MAEAQTSKKSCVKMCVGIHFNIIQRGTKIGNAAKNHGKADFRQRQLTTTRKNNHESISSKCTKK